MFDTWFGRVANALALASFEWGKWLPTSFGVGVLAAIGRMSENASPVEVAIAFIVVSAPILVVCLAVHAWRSRRPPLRALPAITTTPPPSNQGGDHASQVILTARDNSRIHYTVINNYFQIKEDREKGDAPRGASLKFNPLLGEILNASNVSSITDVGKGEYLVAFYNPLDQPQGYSLTASTQIASISANSAYLKFDENKALQFPIIDVNFKSTSGSG